MRQQTATCECLHVSHGVQDIYGSISKCVPQGPMIPMSGKEAAAEGAASAAGEEADEAEPEEQ